jgi:hypothetical protein
MAQKKKRYSALEWHGRFAKKAVMVELVIVALILAALALGWLWQNWPPASPRNGVVVNKCFSVKLPATSVLRERHDSKCQLTATGESGLPYFDAERMPYNDQAESLVAFANRDTLDASDASEVVSRGEIMFANQKTYRLTIKLHYRQVTRYFVTMPGDTTHLMALTFDDDPTVDGLVTEVENTWKWASTAR